ncbi:hypothetical protein [Brachybacterium sp. GPGPB12]|uniref:hypothetical protein n=1 Tax=Brachybacterium sp. GPGPB12 TaxID=3023517 RepID=UPI0031344D58
MSAPTTTATKTETSSDDVAFALWFAREWDHPGSDLTQARRIWGDPDAADERREYVDLAAERDGHPARPGAIRALLTLDEAAAFDALVAPSV